MSDRSLRQVFGVPSILQILTLVGLVAALLDDGIWDVVSWIALAIPLLVIGWHLWGRR
jgi:hypothetical protein